MTVTTQKRLLISFICMAGVTMLTPGVAIAGPGQPGHHDADPGKLIVVDQASAMHHGHQGETLAGHPGNPEDVDRIIVVRALDSMALKIESPLQVKDGETIKFVVINEGSIKHEFSIGTKDEHAEHGVMMMDNPDMHHPPGTNTVSLAPGETQTLIWTFEEAWQVEVACNVPGHYQAGMVSKVEFAD